MNLNFQEKFFDENYNLTTVTSYRLAIMQNFYVPIYSRSLMTVYDISLSDDLLFNDSIVLIDFLVSSRNHLFSIKTTIS